MDEEIIPLPSDEATPPVTKMYFVSATIVYSFISFTFLGRDGDNTTAVFFCKACINPERERSTAWRCLLFQHDYEITFANLLKNSRSCNNTGISKLCNVEKE